VVNVRQVAGEFAEAAEGVVGGFVEEPAAEGEARGERGSAEDLVLVLVVRGLCSSW